MTHSWSERPVAARSSMARGDGADARPALMPLRLGGALALLAMGAVHLQQAVGADYSQIPTIGTLFYLNFAGALVVALALLLPLDRMVGRLGAAATSVAALAGIGMGAVSIVFLLLSEHQTVFGFREAGYASPIVVALVSEGAAVVLLAAYLAARVVRRD
jgi:hypothetical protein